MIDSLVATSTDPEAGHETGESVWPTVSVVVLNFNGRGITPSCIESVYSSDYPALELIVVDNSPEDGSVAEAVSGRLSGPIATQVVQMSSNVGFCTGFNIGIERAKGDFLLLLNNDAVIRPDSVRRLVEFMVSHPEVGLCEGKIVNTGRNFRGRVSNPDIARWAGVFVHANVPELDEGQFSEPREIFSAIGVWPFVRRQTLQSTGPYDPDFFICNEIRDWCWRVWLAGFTVSYVPFAITDHIGRLEVVSQSYGSEIKANNVFHEAKNSVQILLKNLSVTDGLRILPANAMVRSLELGWLLSSGRTKHARLKLRGYVWVLRHLDDIMRKRREVRTKIKTVRDRQAERALKSMNPLTHLQLYRRGDVFAS